MAEIDRRQKRLIGILLCSTLLFAAVTCWLAWQMWQRSTWSSASEDFTSTLPRLAEPEAETIIVEDEETEKVQVYFLSSDRQRLEPESRAIPRSDSIQEKLQRVLDTLRSGPTRADLYPILPPSVRIRGIYWMPEGLVVVDFSEEILTNHPGQLLSEWATLFGTTNSICAQSSPSAKITAVQFLVEGKIVEDYDTVWDWSSPLEPDKAFTPVGG